MVVDLLLRGIKPQIPQPVKLSNILLNAFIFKIVDKKIVNIPMGHERSQNLEVNL